MPLERTVEKVREFFPGEILEVGPTRADPALVIRKDRCHEILQFLKEDPELSFDMMVDLCGVDYLKFETQPRFELVYHLYSLTHNHRLRVRVKVSEDSMSLPTVIDLWKTADWFEREAYDMFGFRFEGHPNLKRLLLFEGFEGHPLRKDYPIEKRQKIPLPEETQT